MGYLTSITSLVLVNSDLNPAYEGGITGTIPASFSRLTNLRVVSMWGNSFISPIPDEWLAEAKLIEQIVLNRAVVSVVYVTGGLPFPSFMLELDLLSLYPVIIAFFCFAICF